MHKILIIEDNTDVRENLSEILMLSGYETATAPHGKAGVQTALSFLPDLILCDIMMPELDGYGVLRILSKNEATASIPFIFLSAKTELTDVRRGMTLGADDYITKPFDDVELLDTIEIRLKKRHQHPSIPTAASPALIHPPSGEEIFKTLLEMNADPEWRSIRKKDLLFSEGQTCRYVFLIRSGMGMSTKADDFSKEVVTRLYHHPMIIGLSSVLVGGRYKETVRAFEDLEVLPIRKETFLQFVAEDSQVGLHFLQQLADWQLKTDEKLLLQAFGTVRMKLAATLLDLYHTKAANGKAVITIAREDLAAMAGTAKETIIRCLSEFKEEGIIAIEGPDIIIDAVGKLTALRY